MEVFELLSIVFLILIFVEFIVFEFVFRFVFELLLIIVLFVDSSIELVDVDGITLRVAVPNSILRHLDAKFNEQIVSLTLYEAGEILTNINTFELPPKLSCNKNVNLELRYGICVDFLLPSAEITSPNADKLRLLN